VSLFLAAHAILRPLGGFRFLLARLGHEPVGVMSLLFHAGVVTYWYSGTLRDGRRSARAICWSAARSSGTSERMPGAGHGRGRTARRALRVRDFKAKYGGALVDYGRDVWERSAFRMRLATTGFELARRFVS